VNPPSGRPNEAREESAGLAAPARTGVRDLGVHTEMITDGIVDLPPGRDYRIHARKQKRADQSDGRSGAWNAAVRPRR
jgi:hypothetical protein